MNSTVQEITFRDSRAPHELQAMLEREIMAVLRPQRETGRLVYRAAFKVNGAPYGAMLRHELALRSANVYVLRFELDLDRVQPANRDYELKGMAGWVNLWTRELQPQPLPQGETGREDRRVALEQEAFAVEARCTTAADYQKAVVEGMRSGGYYSTAHKEGGTHLRFSKGIFVRQDYGESQTRTTYSSEGDFLTALRTFFHWEVARGCTPDEPAEEVAWRLLYRLMRHDSNASAWNASGHGRRVFMIPLLGWPLGSTGVLVGFLGMALLGLWGFNRILTSRTTGMPMGDSVRAAGYVATLIQRQEPYLPSLHRNPARDRYRLDLLLTPVTGQGERRLVSLLRREQGANSHAASRLFGQDGDLLWLRARELMAYHLTEHRLIREKEILAVNPTLKELIQQSIPEFDGQLRLTTRDQRRSVVLDAETLVAHPVEVVSSEAWMHLDPKPETYFASRADSGTNEWFGVLSAEEVKHDYQPGYLVPRKAEMGKALSVRRLYSGRTTPEKDRARLVDFRALSETEFVGGALVRRARLQEPLRLSGPDGYLVTFLSSQQREAVVMIARVTLDGREVWRTETPLGNLTQALGGTDLVVLVGQRPPEPNRVPEPLAVAVNIADGTLRAHSLWTKDP